MMDTNKYIDIANAYREEIERRDTSDMEIRLALDSIANSLLAVAISLKKLVDMKEMEQELETLE